MRSTTYRPDPSVKLFAYNNDFSGGMNSVDADSTLVSSQMREITNMELTTKGSLVKREGFVRYATATVDDEGIGLQCHIQYYDEDKQLSEFYITNGTIYDSEGTVQEYKNLDGEFVEATGFQTSRLMDYLVYNDILLLATGNFLLEYGKFPDDEENTTESYYFRQLEPYKPTALEYSRVGANLLSDDPLNFISDGVASIIVNEGIVTKHRTATANIEEEITTYISRPASESVSIKWEIQESGKDEWKDVNGGYKEANFDTQENKRINYVFETAGLYNIRSSVTATSNLTSGSPKDNTKVYTYVLSEFEVTESEDIEADEEYKPQTCTRLMLYYDQILLWDDENVPNAVYVSDIFKPSYVPSDNVMLFEMSQEDSVTAILYYYNVLTVFTKNTIFALSGKNPSEFSVKPINQTVGCVAPRSAVAVENYIIFLSGDGLYRLKTLSTINVDNFNIDKIDLDIYESIPKPYDELASAVQYGLAYIITMPKYNMRFKWYYRQDVWAMDKSTIMDFNFTKVISGNYYGYRPNGNVVKQDGSVYTDDGELFSCILETKDDDIGLPYHPKKFKTVKLSFMNDETNPTDVYMTVYVGAEPIINPEKYNVYEQDDQILWNKEKLTNVQLYSGTKFGSWVIGQSALGIIPTTMQKYRLTGKGYTIKLKIEHKDNTDFGILGYAYVYKVKKP